MSQYNLTVALERLTEVLGVNTKLSDHDSQLFEILTEGLKPITETIVTIQRKFTNFNKQLFL